MTKKKTTPSTKTTKKTKAAAPKEKVAAKAKTSSAQKEITKPKAEKKPTTRTAKASPQPAPKKRGRKPKDPTGAKKEAVSRSNKGGESKVKEISSKTKSKIVEEKRETKGFSLDDVRQILQVKTKKTAEKPKASSSKATASKPEKKSVVSTKRKVAKVKKVQTASIDDILGFGTFTQSVRPIRDEKKVPKEWLTYFKNLMDLRASLKGALGERSQDTLGASARESSGELSLNSSDAGSETFNRDVALSMVANEQEALEEIEDAIDRIFDGSFGICQETQKPIKKTRLKVVPFTRFSLEGQTLYEKRKRKDVDSGGGTFATIADSTMGVEE
jgi:DnaK suppressor protein